MRKDELADILSDLEHLLGHYKRLYYRATFPDDCRKQVERLRQIAEDYRQQAGNLESEILSCVAQKEEIERDLFRVAFTLERVRKAKRKGTVTRERLAEIQRVARKLADRIERD